MGDETLHIPVPRQQWPPEPELPIASDPSSLQRPFVSVQYGRAPWRRVLRDAGYHALTPFWRAAVWFWIPPTIILSKLTGRRYKLLIPPR